MTFKYPLPEDLVLVAILPSPRDLQLARMLGWYRIPARSAPKILHVDYLAFYQPACFGKGHRWKVEYIARVKGHELTTRLRLISDEPDHPRAHEEYYKIQLGPLRVMPRSISAGAWKRFIFLYTNGKNLRRAVVLKDLTVQPSERKMMWKALRDRSARAKGYGNTSEEKDEIPPEILAFIKGLAVRGQETDPDRSW